MNAGILVVVIIVTVVIVDIVIVVVVVIVERSVCLSHGGGCTRSIRCIVRALAVSRQSA